METGKNQRSHPSELISTDVAQSNLRRAVWVGAIAFIMPIAMAALFVVHFPKAVSLSWTPYILMGPAIPIFVYIVSQRSGRQREQIKSILTLSWGVWALMGLVTLFYYLNGGNREFATSLEQFSPGWFTLVFAWLFSAICSRIALLIGDFLYC